MPTAEQQTEAWVRRLAAQPGALPCPARHASLLQTHLSWLLLAGAHAYKFKKPLTLDFVDFGSAEQRRAACEEELRLGRRTAPELYLEVLPVTGTPAAPRLGGSGAAFDWAVHMRRFPADAVLAERAARGALEATQIDALAREIAAFQAHAERAPEGSPWGDTATLRQLVADCLPPIAPAVAGTPLANELNTLSIWTAAEGARLAPLMAERRAAGFVREGHGDLHLGNLLWLDGRPRLFDAIEFNPALRWGDTAGDIAFLFMDLLAHGLAPLAWRFLNAWLEQTGDFGALLRLPFDAVYRALVRAKVAALRLAQAGAADDVAAQNEAQADLARYLHLATRLGQPRRPWLALTVGVSGSGKSSQTQALVEARGLIRLRADVERKRLFGLAPEAASAGVAGGIYGEAVSDRLFARLLASADTLLAAGWPVLVDATFIRRVRRAPFIALARQRGLPWRLLAFDAPEPVLRERVRQRQAAGGDASEANEAVLASQLAHREPLASDEATHALHIDTTQAVDWSVWQGALPATRN